VALYAAYARNLDPREMFIRAPHSPQQGTGWLDDWRLTFGGDHWDGALVTLVEHPGSQVFLCLYDLATEDEPLLDEWEGMTIDLYSKIRVRVRTRDGNPLVWLYVLNDYEGGLPSATYLGAIADAAEACGAPHSYVQELRNRPCDSNEPLL